MNRLRINSRALLGALTGLGVVSAGMVSAPAANATCISIFGIGSGRGCTSTLTSVAIGIGTDAVANASGFLGAAVAIGIGAQADASHLDLALAAGPESLAQVVGSLSVAIAAGNQGGTTHSTARAGYDEFGNTRPSDFANIALTLASDSLALAGGLGDPNSTRFDAGNLAVNLGRGNSVEALGFLNSALAVGGNKPFGTLGNNDVWAAGILNNATHIGGNLNLVQAGDSPKSLLNLAFNAFGSYNGVFAGVPGKKFALAGAILQNDATISRESPGININGVEVPKTAATVRGARVLRPTTGASLIGARAVKPSAATTVRGSSQRPAGSAKPGAGS